MPETVRKAVSSHRWRILDRHAWVLSAVLCLPALVPLLVPGWYEGHDDLHVFRLIEYDLVLRDGQVPPRWFPDISAGYGNPHPNYYAPLFYLVAEFFHLLGPGIITSLKAAIVVIMLVSAIAMFQYARLFWGPTAALVAATAYTYAPYHLLDLYVRKAFSELTVFAFLPLLLLSLHNLRERGSRWDMIVGSLALAAMSTAHTITTMLVPALVGAYVLVLSVRRGREGWTLEWRWLGKVVIVISIGYAIAGFFLVPAYLERAAIDLRIYTASYVRYDKHFVYPRQLIWSPWGFGLSLPGLQDKMSFRLGLLQIAGTVLAASAFSKMRRLSPSGARHGFFYLWVTAAAIFMTLPASGLLWAALPPLKFVQFPWRFLTLATFSMAFLCGAAFAVWGPPRPSRDNAASQPRRWRAALALCALFCLAAGLGGTLGVHRRLPVDRVDYEERPYNDLVARGVDAPAPTFDAAFVRAHTLRWFDHLPAGVSYTGLTRRDAARAKAEVVRGRARISRFRQRSWMIGFRVEADGPALVRINTYRFPGWTIRVDGRPTAILQPRRHQPVLFLDVAQGDHQVLAVFTDTPPRRFGDGLTLAGLGALAAIGLWPHRTRRTSETPRPRVRS
ncbi:MAG: 6-pyruvoyl-tetrahydropterin synthase-related protein [Acidobacteriota bacterium]